MVLLFVLATIVSAVCVAIYYSVSGDWVAANGLATIVYQGGFFVTMVVAVINHNASIKIKDYRYGHMNKIDSIRLRCASFFEILYVVTSFVFMVVVGVSLGGLFGLAYLDGVR